ncbi:aldehyde dehydrogenase family protein [Nakamurella endophytica]|uniref:Aldehyde dehydrogenase n=1 Tax=Nakamurella endophytica TaxID=1748367 RepID=A0A917WDR4_9ACTN|nr:aldehyde dehydrogenase family protein [Nakamurella endophytica]GGL93541.1 aldehyde dehydrogenase [Nakamurella endophytica]
MTAPWVDPGPPTVPPALQVPADRLPVGPDGVAVAGSAPVRFPYDGSTVAAAPVGDAALATLAVDHAVAARPAGAATTAGIRRAVLTDVADWMRQHGPALVDLLVAETGKPRVDCQVEVTRTILTWSLAAEEPARPLGETIPVDLLPGADGMTAFWTRRPAGVVVGIAGFNYPLLLASHKLAPAVAAGCPVIVKPAPTTPLATLALVEAVRDALRRHGRPVTLAQAVTGDTAVGVALTTDERVAVVSFTGSAGVGHAIARAAAPRKVLLELGSNASLLVADDADLDAAADAVLRGGFYASGQACISVQRVIAARTVAAELAERVRRRLPEVRVGDPRDPATRVSTLIDDAATRRVRSWVDDALAAGATVAAGRHGADGPLEPLILADVPSGVAVWDEEVFGPVVCLRTVDTFEEGLELANRTRYGLHASVFTRSLARAYRAIDELEVGGVIVNEVPGFRSDAMPYGGVKDSGIGREGPHWAVQEFTVTRTAVIRP